MEKLGIKKKTIKLRRLIMFNNKKSKLTVFLVLILTATVAIKISNSDSEEKTVLNQDTRSLQQVDSKYVCMVTNKLFNKEQIPTEMDGKTYYGCCEMCKGTLANDPTSRFGVDPLTKNNVDKALSVTAAGSDGSIYYFENEKNLQEFNKIIDGKINNEYDFIFQFYTV